MVFSKIREAMKKGNLDEKGQMEADFDAREDSGTTPRA
jgi:hypothetical protein